MLGTRQSTDTAAGVFLAVLGIVTAWAATGIDEGAGGHLHPRTFPILVGVLLFIGGAILSARAAITGAGAEKAIGWPDRRGWKFWVACMASLMLYVGLSQPLGFLISTFIFVPWFIWYFGRYRPLVTVSCALGIVAFIYFVFIRLLELTLPLGPLSFLG